MISRKRAIAARAVVTLLLAAVATTVMGGGAALADDSGGIGITVSVTAPPEGSTSSSSSSSNSVLPTAALPGVASGTRTSALGAATVVTPVAPAIVPVPAADEFNLGGLLFVSGVTTDYGWSINPLAGDAHAQFTVHNVSTETIDSTANFEVVGPFGNEIAHIDDVTIMQLKPDESRVIEATMPGLGQWAFFTIHATLVPPATVQGTALTPVTRDGFMFVLPWFVVVLLILVFGAYSVVRIVRDADFGRAPGAQSAGLAEGAA